MSDEYMTLRSPCSGEIEEKRSRFIASAAPVETEEQAVEFINSVKAANRKARHNVYAYILRDGNISRYSDDGEPQGTGGVPVLETIKKEGLTDICVVVTRYFGGILLGAGGLVRAYSSGAADAVKAAGVEKHIPGALIALRCDYSRYGAIESLIAKSNAEITESEFTDEIRLSISCAKKEADSIIKAIIERTDGRCRPELAGECELVPPQ